MEARALSLDFGSAFDLVNHEGLLYKIKSYGTGGAIFNVFQNFLSHQQQRIYVGCCFSPFNHGPLFFILYTADMWHNLENSLVAYADDATLYASIDSPLDRFSIASSLNRDISRI